MVLLPKLVKMPDSSGNVANVHRLVERGVPKQDIVLAYRARHVRQYTEFGVG